MIRRTKLQQARRDRISPAAPANPCWQHIAYERDHAGSIFGILPPA